MPLAPKAAVTVPVTEVKPDRFAFNVASSAVTAILPLPAAVTVFSVACAADKLNVAPSLTEMVSWPDRDTFDILIVFAAAMVLLAAIIAFGKSALLIGKVVAAFNVKVTFAKLSAERFPPAVTAATPVVFSAIVVLSELLNADA